MKTRARRLFFALWPDADTVQRLAELQGHLPVVGRPVAPANLHMTLAFIGNAWPVYEQCLRVAANAVHFVPFSLHLDKLGYFRRPRILWLGPSQVPLECSRLYEDLVEHLQVCGFEPDRSHFKPHVSLARKSEALAGGSLAPVTWEIDRFALIESQLTDTGAVYRVVQEYPAGTVPG